MSILKKIGLAVVIIVFGVVGAMLHYALPRHNVVHITGIDVKRMDNDGVISATNPADGPTRDVYFIYTENPTTKETSVYRNEDTRWGLPWYFKFNSADVQARAQALSNDNGTLALIRSYGWRLQLFSKFPNITSIRQTDSLKEPFPLFVVIFLSALILVIVIVSIKIRQLVKSRFGS